MVSERLFTKSSRVRPSAVSETVAGIEQAVGKNPAGSTIAFRGRPRLRANTSSSPSSR